MRVEVGDGPFGNVHAHQRPVDLQVDGDQQEILLEDVHLEEMKAERDEGRERWRQREREAERDGGREMEAERDGGRERWRQRKWRQRDGGRERWKRSEIERESWSKTDKRINHIYVCVQQCS